MVPLKITCSLLEIKAWIVKLVNSLWEIFIWWNWRSNFSVQATGINSNIDICQGRSGHSQIAEFCDLCHHTMLQTSQLLPHQQTQGHHLKILNVLYLNVLYFPQCSILKKNKTKQKHTSLLSFCHVLFPTLPPKLNNSILFIIILKVNF